MSIHVRKATESDLRFVASSWCDSWRTSYYAGLIPMNIWGRVMRDCLHELFQRPGLEILVAGRPGAVEGVADVSAWLCYERGFLVQGHRLERGRRVQVLETSTDPLVHWAFTKQSYRKLGLQRALLKAAGIDKDSPLYYSCRAPIVNRLKLHRATWNPLIARFPKKEKDNASKESQQT